MDKSFRQLFLLLSAGILLFAGVSHLDVIGSFLKDTAALLGPVILGLSIRQSLISCIILESQISSSFPYCSAV